MRTDAPKDEKRVQTFSLKTNGRDKLRDIGVVERIILRWILKKLGWEYGLDISGS
jgi:hypothetical protein